MGQTGIHVKNLKGKIAELENNLEKSLITNKAITSSIKEKDNALALMELQISEMKKELDGSKRECFQTRSHVEKLKEKNSELEKAVIEKTSVMYMYVKSKQQI